MEERSRCITSNCPYKKRQTEKESTRAETVDRKSNSLCRFRCPCSNRLASNNQKPESSSNPYRNRSERSPDAVGFKTGPIENKFSPREDDSKSLSKSEKKAPCETDKKPPPCKICPLSSFRSSNNDKSSASLPPGKSNYPVLKRTSTNLAPMKQMQPETSTPCRAPCCAGKEEENNFSVIAIPLNKQTPKSAPSGYSKSSTKPSFRMKTSLSQTTSCKAPCSKGLTYTKPSPERAVSVTPGNPPRTVPVPCGNTSSSEICNKKFKCKQSREESEKNFSCLSDIDYDPCEPSEPPPIVSEEEKSKFKILYDIMSYLLATHIKKTEVEEREAAERNLSEMQSFRREYIEKALKCTCADPEEIAKFSKLLEQTESKGEDSEDECQFGELDPCEMNETLSLPAINDDDDEDIECYADTWDSFLSFRQNCALFEWENNLEGVQHSDFFNATCSEEE